MKVKVLTWNIWQGAYLDEVKRFLKETDPDIVALQEVSDDGRNILADIAGELGYTYVSALDMSIPMKYVPEHLRTEATALQFGNAIMTKHQIISSEPKLISEEDNRTVITAKIKIEDTVLSVFGLHLKHTHQEPSDLQNEQVDNLIKIIPETKAIALGDFNSLPGSYPINRMREAFKDTDSVGDIPTWSMYRDGCSLCQEDKVIHKLDYIFVTPDITAESFSVGQSDGADHLPVVVTLEV